MSTSPALPYLETPLIPSLYLSDITGASVYLKMEVCQPSGSFKSRGLGNLVYQTVMGNNPNIPKSQNHKFSLSTRENDADVFPPNNYYHFFSPSGGNAGCATAYAAKKYNQSCTVCLPTVSNPIMIERIKKTGANVVVYGDNIAEADEHIKKVLIPACTQVPVYCHPYNDPLVWEGNSTVADEIVKQLNHGKNVEAFMQEPSKMFEKSATFDLCSSSSVSDDEEIPATEPVCAEKNGFINVSSDPVIQPPPSPPTRVQSGASTPYNKDSGNQKNGNNNNKTSSSLLPPSPIPSSLSLSSSVAANPLSKKKPTRGLVLPRAVVCSVGGGGLYNGIVQSLSKYTSLLGKSEDDNDDKEEISILAVETEGCCTLNQSIQRGGEQVEVLKPQTIATSLSTKSVTRETIDYAMNKLSYKSAGGKSTVEKNDKEEAETEMKKKPLLKTHSVVISDKEAAEACINFLHDHKVMVEAACGTALSPLYTKKINKVLPNLTPDDIIVVVVCGGTSISWEIMQQYSKTFEIPL